MQPYVVRCAMSLVDWDRGNCSVARALELIGDRHTVLVLREAFVGERRFDRIQRHTGVARNILSDRLNKLVAYGILTRRPYQERPVRHEYVLTEKGLDLYPVLVGLMQWGERHGGGETPILLQHKACGATVEPHLACPECGEARRRARHAGATRPGRRSQTDRLKLRLPIRPTRPLLGREHAGAGQPRPSQADPAHQRPPSPAR